MSATPFHIVSAFSFGVGIRVGDPVYISLQFNTGYDPAFQRVVRSK